LEIITPDMLAEAGVHELGELSNAIANSDIKPQAPGVMRQEDL
jgi:hypothetical protein